MTEMSMPAVFEKIVRSRRSVRGFKPQQVDRATLEKVFELAQAAPSNCNTQPWHVHVVNGDVTATISKRLIGAMAEGDFAMDFPYSGKYEGEYKKRQHDAAAQLFTAMGIAREDKAGRNAAFFRNFELFGAPHAAFLFLPQEFGMREAADVGMYAQNLMLALTAHGIACCPQTALSFQADVVRGVLQVPDDMKLLFGISFGYEDENVLANKARVGRESVHDAVTFHG